MQGRHGRRRRGWMRQQNRMLEPALLLLLHNGPAHGYTFLDRLSEYGLVEVNPSVVYRTLRDMETRGLIESSWDDMSSHGPPRRVYRITSAGDTMLTSYTDELMQTRHMIDHLLSEYRDHMREYHGDDS